jgi:hypothetical protein
MEGYSVAHVMSVIGVMTACSLLVSLACWALLGRSLQGVLGFLCDDPRDEVKAVSGEFWKRLYALLILMVPLLIVLLFAPNFGDNIAYNLLYSMRAAFLGGVSVLLVLAYLIRRQIQVIQKGNRLNRLNQRYAVQPLPPVEMK